MPNRCEWNAPRCRLGSALLPGTEVRSFRACYLKMHAFGPLGIRLISVHAVDAETGSRGGPVEMKKLAAPNLVLANTRI